ncbi:MAG: ABC transporter ATP-binding protein [Anaerolineaceae bacterium]|nr:ABC transporter ATP-binding protein [Anaerolineaceae bacterium]
MVVNDPAVMETRGLTKRFPGVLACDHIDLRLHEGEVLGLLGENGAGKSTLMNLIYGLYAPDEGEIFIRGQAVDIHSANDAIRLGIGMVHQHFQLVPILTVTENIMLGNESVKGLFLDRNSARRRILEISERYGLEIEPDVLVQDIPVGVQQRVEIIKALYRSADILILDEPTAVLTPQEAEGLFSIMRTLIASGVSIIFISHKLKEIKTICDRAAVLRAGKVVGEADPQEVTEQQLASMMVGREVILSVDKGAAQAGEEILVLEGVEVNNDRDLPAVRGVDLSIREGEILGVAGVQGNGQTELLEALTGLRPMEQGSIRIAGQDVSNESPRVVTETGMAHVPEDRQKNGMIRTFTVKDNCLLQSYYQIPFARGIFVVEEEKENTSAEMVRQYDVRTPSIYVPISSLSGGNQQKVIVAREFSRPIRLLIAAQPTRGLDVGSIEFIHRQIIRMRDEGVAVLLVSSELDEILSLSDRIAVMYHGKILDVVNIEEATREEIGLLMAGVVGQEKVPA